MDTTKDGSLNNSLNDKLTSLPKNIDPTVEQINTLTDIGLYTDALVLAQKEWGPIDSWEANAQILIAIRLMYHLGGDRTSDALLLKAYRKSPDNVKLIERMLYYYMHTYGLILCKEFFDKHEDLLSAAKDLQPNIFAFKSILRREHKDFYAAEGLLQKAQALAPESTWLPSVHCRLLLDQDQDEAALQMAQKNYASTPSVMNLRTYLSVIQKSQGLKAAIEVLKKDITQFQSCILWIQLASMAATELDWTTCEYALNNFNKIKVFTDKNDEQRVISYVGQIQLHHQQYEQALGTLKQHKGRYWQLVCKNLEKAEPDANITVLDVPFYRQEHLTCAPTTMAAIANFWGKNIATKTIADEICFDGTPETRERQWLRDNDFSFIEFNLQTPYVYQLIDAGLPFCLVTSSGFSSHLQAVIGYNKHIGSMYIMDPSCSGMQEMLIEQTLEYEGYGGPRCMVFVPREIEEKLAEFNPPDALLYEYWDTFCLANEVNDFHAAAEALSAMNTADQEHLLSKKAGRNYALISGDYAKVQEYNNNLLKRFPKETILLNSQYFCLRDLGRRAEALDSLELYLDKNVDINLCKTLFDEIYDTHERPELSEKLLKLLKRYGSYHEGVYQSLANYSWANQEREKASDLYLIAYCLDDTNNFNIENYFKACRFLQKQDIAIAFLSERFEKYAARSPLPAISLFKAYELMNEEHKGLAYLEQAVALHPKDIALLNLFSRELIKYGLFDKFEQQQACLQGILSADDYEALLAELAIKQGNAQQAVSFYQRMFERSPLVQSTANAYFGLLYKLNQTEKLDATLSQLLEQYPDNIYVYDYIVDFHSDEKKQKQALQQAVKDRPDSGQWRRKLIDKLLRLGDKQEALSLAKETAELIKGEHANLAFLAKVYVSCGEFEKGKCIAQKVLGLDVDNDLAFEILMNASRQPSEKEQSLHFVFSEIKKQTVFGDSAWNFWFDASTVLPNEMLKEFVSYVEAHLAHVWYSYAIAGFYRKQLGHIDKAIDCFEQGIDKFPFTPRLHKELGHLYEITEQTASAIESYKAALEINPGWAEVTKQLVDLYEKQGEFDLAIKVLMDTTKHTVDDGILYGFMADLYIRQQNDDAALAALKKAVEYQADYDWAWHQIQQIAARRDQPQLAYNLALSIRDKYSYLAQVWINLANMTEGRDEKHAHIRKAIAVNPLNQNAYIALVNYFQYVGDYQSAFDVFKDTPWDNDLPFNLQSLKADLYAQIGQLENAVETLKPILFTTSGYSQLWQNYYSWLNKLDRIAEIIESTKKQIALNLYDSNSLCIAAEMLDTFGQEAEKKEAKQQLTKAYNLAPNDQYIVLTLVDLLVAEKDFSTALTTLERFETFASSHFAKAREVMCLLGLDRTAEAIAAYHDLLSQEDADYWCLNKPFESLIQTIGFASSIDIYEQRLTQCNEVQAYIWADAILSEKGLSAHKLIVKEVEKANSTLLTQGAIRAIFEAWNDADSKGEHKVIDKYIDVCLLSNPVFEQFCMLMLRNKKYQALIDVYLQIQDKSSVSMFSYYQTRCAYQMLDQWAEATAVIAMGIEQQPDSSIHNLRLWYFYDIWRNGSIFDPEELDIVDYHELIEVERYVFSTLKAAMLAGDRDMESCLDDITPALERCQQDNQEAVGNPLATAAQKLLKERLMARISSTGFLQKWLMKWKISNRF